MMKYQLTRFLKPATLSLAFAVAATVGMVSTANALVYKYSEPTGTFVSSFTGSVGSTGELAGQNISDISPANFLGIDFLSYHIVGPSTKNNGIYLIETTPYLFATSLDGLLTGGPLNNQSLKNSNYLGAASNSFFYIDSSTGKVAGYTELGDNSYFGSYNWTTFTGGKYNGKTVASLLTDKATFLTDMGGNIDIEDGIGGIAFVEDDGTLGYYSIITGQYSAFSNVPNSFGSWSTFFGGALDGLSVTSLAANPIGFFNNGGTTYQYRYLGMGSDEMYFDVKVATPVPEPMTSAMMLFGLMALFGVMRKKSMV